MAVSSLRLHSSNLCASLPQFPVYQDTVVLEIDRPSGLTVTGVPLSRPRSRSEELRARTPTCGGRGSLVWSPIILAGWESMEAPLSADGGIIAWAVVVLRGRGGHCVGGVRPCMKQESGVSPLELCLSFAVGRWGRGN